MHIRNPFRAAALAVARLTALAAVSGPAAAQAEAELFTRVEDGLVRAAVEIEIRDGYHIYHGPTKADLGHPEAVGDPTTVELSGESITWSELRFPEPYEEDQSFMGEGVFINAHHGPVVVYALGKLDGGGGDDITAKVKALVCDENGCTPFRTTLESKGEGPDALFAAFPADLKPPSDAPTEDVIEGGNVDTTLYTRVVGGNLRAALQLELPVDWYVYHGPTKAEMGSPKAVGQPTVVELEGAGVVWSPVFFPEPVEKDQDFVGAGEYVNIHEGPTVVLYAEGSLTGGADGSGAWGTIEGQSCDPERCLPFKETFVSQGEGPDAVWADYDEVVAGYLERSKNEGGEGAEEGGADAGLLAFLGLAVFWGLITLLMPCTYPMIPITISFFTKQADARGGKVLPLSLTYGLGIVLIFILIGVVIGPAIIPFATHPVTNLVIGAAFVFFAFVLFGFVNLQPPRFLMNVAGKASAKGGFAGVFLMGATLVVTSFTCTAPFVGNLLATGAQDGSLSRIVMGMGVFGLTMAIPFVALSLVPGRIQAMPQSGQWMNTLKVYLGFVELAAAFKFFSNADYVWNWLVISREFFLALWLVIFGVAALYLFGVVRIKGKEELGPKRIVAGVLTALFAAYCGWGLSGKPMPDVVMAAMVPPYSGGRFFPELYDNERDWTIVEDDYARALEVARGSDKLLLVNFTGKS